MVNEFTYLALVYDREKLSSVERGSKLELSCRVHRHGEMRKRLTPRHDRDVTSPRQNHNSGHAHTHQEFKWHGHVIHNLKGAVSIRVVVANKTGLNDRLRIICAHGVTEQTS